jgi:hypothetical protein
MIRSFGDWGFAIGLSDPVKHVVTTEKSKMLKQLLTASSVAALLVTLSLSAQAQTRQPAAPAQPAAPQTSPPSAPGASPQASPQAAPITVSSAEVDQFANAIKELRTIQEDAQTQASQAIQGQGLSVERFNQLLQNQRNPQSQPPANVTSQERQNFDQAMSKVGEIQQSTQTRMEEAIKKQGLDVPRFNQIFAAVRQDPNLRQQIQQKIQN